MFALEELQEASRALRSLLSKCEKTLPRLREGSSQHTLLRRRIRALEIAAALTDREIAGQPEAGPGTQEEA